MSTSEVQESVNAWMGMFKESLSYLWCLYDYEPEVPNNPGCWAVYVGWMLEVYRMCLPKEYPEMGLYFDLDDCLHAEEVANRAKTNTWARCDVFSVRSECS